MALMLDTCGLLSLIGLAEQRLSTDTLSSIEIADTVYISSCSLFEIAIKQTAQWYSAGYTSGAPVDLAMLTRKQISEYISDFWM